MENKQAKITFGEFKKLFSDEISFIITAGEDIRGGFGKKGWSLYGNCDDLIVMNVNIYNNEIINVILGNRIRND